MRKPAIRAILGRRLERGWPLQDLSPKQDAVWVRQLIGELEQQGYPTLKILRQAGVDKNRLDRQGSRITIASYAEIFERAAVVTGDGCLGLNFGRTRDLRDAGLIAYVGLSSATLNDAIKNIHRYRRVFSDAVEVDIDNLDTNGEVHWWFRCPVSQGTRQYLEFSGANVLTGFRRMAGRELAPIRVSFTHPRNAEIAAFEKVFGCPVEFGRVANSIQFRMSDLQAPLVTNDDRLLTILRGHCEDVLSRRRNRPPSPRQIRSASSRSTFSTNEGGRAAAG